MFKNCIYRKIIKRKFATDLRTDFFDFLQMFAAEVPTDMVQKTGRISLKTLPKRFLRIIMLVYPQEAFLRFLESSGPESVANSAGNRFPAEFIPKSAGISAGKLSVSGSVYSTSLIPKFLHYRPPNLSNVCETSHRFSTQGINIHICFQDDRKLYNLDLLKDPSTVFISNSNPSIEKCI